MMAPEFDPDLDRAGGSVDELVAGHRPGGGDKRTAELAVAESVEEALAHCRAWAARHHRGRIAVDATACSG